MKKIRAGLKIPIVLILFSITCLLEMFSTHEWNSGVTRFDVSGYYLYLPATFIYHDVQHLDFYPYVDSAYHPTNDIKWYAIYDQPQTGKRLNKYPVGVAIGELPLFLIAHAVALHSSEYKADGYSRPYQFTIGISTFLWSLIGLYFLGKLLKPLWGENVAAITIFLIGFGTNLFCYTITNLGMAHAFLFMLFSMLLYYTKQWHEQQKARYLYAIAMLLGLIFISRPTDIIVAMIPVFWGLYNQKTLWDKLQLLRKAWGHLLGSTLVFTTIIFLLLGYWKAVTGHWLYFSYQHEKFNFGNPAIYKGLFSYEKGWFVYTPLALFGMLGLIPLFRRSGAQAILVFFYFLITIYVVFSWEMWWYGWGFGCRPLIESLAVLSLPLAALISHLYTSKKGIRGVSIAVGLFLIFLNIYQTHQYMNMALPGEGITKEYYWRVWNRMHADDEDRKLLR